MLFRPEADSESEQSVGWQINLFFNRELSRIRELPVAKLSGRPKQTWRSFRGFTEATVASLSY